MGHVKADGHGNICYTLAFSSTVYEITVHSLVYSHKHVCITRECEAEHLIRHHAKILCTCCFKVCMFTGNISVWKYNMHGVLKHTSRSLVVHLPSQPVWSECSEPVCGWRSQTGRLPQRCHAASDRNPEWPGQNCLCFPAAKTRSIYVKKNKTILYTIKKTDQCHNTFCSNLELMSFVLFALWRKKLHNMCDCQIWN